MRFIITIEETDESVDMEDVLDTFEEGLSDLADEFESTHDIDIDIERA